MTKFFSEKNIICFYNESINITKGWKDKLPVWKFYLKNIKCLNKKGYRKGMRDIMNAGVVREKFPG